MKIKIKISSLSLFSMIAATSAEAMEISSNLYSLYDDFWNGKEKEEAAIEVAIKDSLLDKLMEQREDAESQAVITESLLVFLKSQVGGDITVPLDQRVQTFKNSIGINAESLYEAGKSLDILLTGVPGLDYIEKLKNININLMEVIHELNEEKAAYLALQTQLDKTNQTLEQVMQKSTSEVEKIKKVNVGLTQKRDQEKTERILLQGKLEKAKQEQAQEQEQEKAAYLALQTQLAKTNQTLEQVMQKSTSEVEKIKKVNAGLTQERDQEKTERILLQGKLEKAKQEQEQEKAAYLALQTQLAKTNQTLEQVMQKSTSEVEKIKKVNAGLTQERDQEKTERILLQEKLEKAKQEQADANNKLIKLAQKRDQEKATHLALQSQLAKANQDQAKTKNTLMKAIQERDKAKSEKDKLLTPTSSQNVLSPWQQQLVTSRREQLQIGNRAWEILEGSNPKLAEVLLNAIKTKTGKHVEILYLGPTHFTLSVNGGPQQYRNAY